MALKIFKIRYTMLNAQIKILNLKRQTSTKVRNANQGKEQENL